MYEQINNSFIFDNEKISLLNLTLVSNARKIKWIIFASLFLFFSGIFIGFVPIKSVILHSKIYSELDIDLALVISLTLMSITTYPIGLFLDKYGSKITAIVGAIFQMIGHILVAFCFHYHLPVPVFIISLALDSLANPFVFTSIIQFTRIFKGYEDFLMGYFTGLWDLSALLGFVILLLDKHDISISINFWISGCIYFIFLILIFIIYPKKDIPKIMPEVLPVDNISKDDQNDDIVISNNNTTTLIITIIAASTNILSMNFYMINFKNLLLVWNDKEDAEFIIHGFSILFPTIGFIAAMLSGAITQKFGLKRSIICMNIFQLIFGVMSLIPTYEVHGSAFFSYIFYRMMFYTSINVCVSQINPHKIGQNLGLVYGISSLINLSNYGFSLLANTMENIAFGFYFIHLGMAIIALVSTVFWICFLPKPIDIPK